MQRVPVHIFQLLHGFDTTGRLYNKDGKHENWWPRQLEDVFRLKTKCFIDQYSKTASVDGGLTLSENIADNGGLAAAFGGR